MNVARPTVADRAVGSPRVSVIVPSHNSGTYLRQALASALDQIPPPHEIIVQDGGSTDNTLDVLRSFGDRVSWISTHDEGQSDALNSALARSTGDVVIWLNADDILLPDALNTASAAFAADPHLAFAYGDFDMIDGAGALVRSYRSSPYSWTRVYKQGCYIFSGSLFVRREALLAVGGFDASLRACMDLDLLLRLGTAGRSLHLGRTIAQFRIHGEGKSSNIGLTFVREAFRVRSRYARRSWRLWPYALRTTLVSALMQMTSPLRYSSRWPRHGRGKTL